MPACDPLALLQEIALLAAALEHGDAERATHNRRNLTYAGDTGQPVRLLADLSIHSAASQAIKARAAARKAPCAEENA